MQVDRYTHTQTDRQTDIYANRNSLHASWGEVKSDYLYRYQTQDTGYAPISTYFDTEIGSYSAFAPNLMAHT